VGSSRIGPLQFGTWAFLLVAVGRAGELVPGLSSLPLAKIVLAFTLIPLVHSWKQLPKLVPSVRPLAKNAWWLVVLGLVLTPFSIWPGETVNFLIQDLPILIISFLLAYKMSSSWHAMRGTLLILVVSGLILSKAALSGYSAGGRAAANTMYDTNDLAYVLVTVLPLALGFFLTAKTLRMKLLYLGVVGANLIVILLTASRGGFLGLLTVIVLIILFPLRGGKASRQRLGGIFGTLIIVGCLAAVIWPQLPESTRQRLSTILDLGNDYNLDPNNATSRGQIWKRGMTAAISRPVGFGVGAFPMVDLKFNGRMEPPHNSFVQTAVELGFLGLVLFTRMYVLTWRALGKARRSLQDTEREDQQDLALFLRTLQLSLAGNVVAGFFLSMAYATLLWVTFSVSMGCIALANRSADPAAS
jgi:O-antigen ligase